MTVTSRIALFRRLALELPGAVESAHMNHPDFRLNDRIFATLSGQEKARGVVKLTLEQQHSFLTEYPEAFSPVQGGWGRMGMTYVHLDKADEFLMQGALSTAFNNLVRKQAEKKSSRSEKTAKPARRRLQ
jgi:hypothetical protein